MGNRIFVTSFYHGALLIEVTNNPFGARVVWDRHSTSESGFNEGLHTVMSTPVWRGDCIYGICGKGELRCLDAGTGARIWESDAAVGGHVGLFGTAFFVQQEDRYFVWNDQGELIHWAAELLPTPAMMRNMKVGWSRTTMKPSLSRGASAHTR